ncbi:MAG: response regulator [Thioalkalispiraceae bacterium]|jgi:putative two-component system response regulator
MLIETGKLASQTSPYRILVVDDEPSHLCMVKEVFSPDNYMLSTAANGVGALQAVERHDYDVVVMDNYMPDISGKEVCSRIRNELNKPLLPIVMLTGSQSEEDLSAAFAAGATDFIRKPYSVTELVNRVDRAARQKRLTDQLDDTESVLFALARMVEAKDKVTGDHCGRLMHNAVVFGKKLGLSYDELDALRRGGVLHDIGKVGIPDKILLKEGKLTDDEWQIMKQHTVIGAKLCSGLSSMKKTVDIIRHHHERWDGSGYPYGLSGYDIPLIARVFQIVDIYDALASARPYKKAFSKEKIITIFEEETNKGWRDPELTRIFIELLKNEPGMLISENNVSNDLGAKIYKDIVNECFDDK